MEASIPSGDKGVSSLENISEAEASILSIGHPRVEGAFVFVSPLFILSSYIPSPHPRPLASLHPFHHPRSFEREWHGSTEPARKSIMKLFKFVSNIEISFMPGKLIIEIYRRTRSWPGSRGMIFLFFARPLFPIARPIRISLSHQFSFCEDERADDPPVPRKQLSFNFAHSRFYGYEPTNWRGIVTLKSSLSLCCRARRVPDANELVQGLFYGCFPPVNGR